MGYLVNSNNNIAPKIPDIEDVTGQGELLVFNSGVRILLHVPGPFLAQLVESATFKELFRLLLLQILLFSEY